MKALSQLGTFDQRSSLKVGYTTGVCAAAAAKAATSLLLGSERDQTVKVTLPSGKGLTLGLASKYRENDRATAGVFKDAGSDPDATHGMEILATAEFSGDTLEICGGRGVGTVTRPGLGIPVGQAAINPVPRAMIAAAVESALEERGTGRTCSRVGIKVTIWAPEGEERAKRTMNARLGIIDGISIIGTTGVVRPMSAKAFKGALRPQLRVARAAGYRVCALTPGNKGEKVARERLGFPRLAAVQMSNFPAFALKIWAEVGGSAAVLIGHVGKLAKVAQGSPNTHSQASPLRLDLLAVIAEEQVSPVLAEQVRRCHTAEHAAQVLASKGFGYVIDELAEKASHQAWLWVKGRLSVGTVMTGGRGQIVGRDREAVRILDEVRGLSKSRSV